MRIPILALSLALVGCESSTPRSANETSQSPSASPPTALIDASTEQPPEPPKQSEQELAQLALRETAQAAIDVCQTLKVLTKKEETSLDLPKALSKLVEAESSLKQIGPVPNLFNASYPAAKQALSELLAAEIVHSELLTKSEPKAPEYRGAFEVSAHLYSKHASGGIVVITERSVMYDDGQESVFVGTGEYLVIDDAEPKSGRLRGIVKFYGPILELNLPLGKRNAFRARLSDEQQINLDKSAYVIQRANWRKELQEFRTAKLRDQSYTAVHRALYLKFKSAFQKWACAVTL